MDTRSRVSGSRPQDIRQNNCRAVLNLLTDSDNMTINELVDAMHLSRTATQNILAILQERNMINDAGKRESTDSGGKKAVSYTINPSYKYCVCMTLDSAYIIAEVFDFGMSKVNYYMIDVPTREYSSTIRVAAQAVKSVLEETGLTKDDLFGLTVSVSGTVDSENGILINPIGTDISGGWGGHLHISDDLRNELGFDIPIYLDNLCNFSGFSKLRASPYSSAGSYLYVLAHDKGIGAALIRDGSMLKGAHGLMGEIGHTTIDYASETRCRCGRYGCFESMLYPDTLAERVNKALKSGAQSSLTPGSVSSIIDLFDAADTGDAFACAQVDIIARQFASVLYNAQIMYDPEIIIFHDSYEKKSGYFHSAIVKCLTEITRTGIIDNPQIYFDESNFINCVKAGAVYFCREQYLASENIFSATA